MYSLPVRNWTFSSGSVCLDTFSVEWNLTAEMIENGAYLLPYYQRIDELCEAET